MPMITALELWYGCVVEKGVGERDGEGVGERVGEKERVGEEVGEVAWQKSDQV